ncbi:MAG: tyrosine-type recombinase/integrase [Dehalococcoidia bacterium]
MSAAHILKTGKDSNGRRVRQGLTARAGRRRSGAPPERLTDVRFQVRYRTNGRGSKLRTAGTFDTLREANECRKRVLLQLAAGEDPGRAATHSGVTLREAVKDARDALAETFASSTLRNWNVGIAKLGELGDIPVGQIRWQDFEAWHLSHLNLRPRVRAIYFGHYRTALDRCDLEPNPARNRNLRKAKAATLGDAQGEVGGFDIDDPPSTCPTHAEADALLNCLAHRRGRRTPSPYLEAVTFMALTGVRVCELVAIRNEDVDLERARIWIPKTKKRTRGKRFIPITRELEALIAARAVDGGPPNALLFAQPHDPKAPLTDNGVYKAMMRASSAAGLPSTIGPHDLRHRYISRLIAANIPPPMIQKVVGHSNLTSLERVYAHVLPNEPTAPLELLRDDVVRFFDEGRNLRTT